MTLRPQVRSGEVFDLSEQKDSLFARLLAANNWEIGLEFECQPPVVRGKKT